MNINTKIGIWIMLIVFVGCFLITTVLFRSNIMLQKELNIANLVIKSKDDAIISEQNTYNYKEDCETDAAQLLMKHIEIYIKKRYTKTPKIIAKEVSKKIVFFSKKYDLPPELIVGIVEVESMFNPILESSAGAKGLMQVMPEWVPKLGLKSVNDLHEVDIGIESGIRVFLIHLEEAKGNISGGLYRYVNKDYSYVERVYSSVGRFVTYRTTLEESGKINSVKEEKSDKTNK